MSRRARTLPGSAFLCAIALSACGGGGSPPAAGFTLTLAAPDPVEIGGTGTVAVTVQRAGGHSAAITLLAVSSSPGIAGSGTVAAGASSGTLNLVVSTAATAASHPITVLATDGAATAQAALTLPVLAAMVIGTHSPLAVGAVSSPFTLQLATTGASGAVTWTLETGTLPPGLTLAPTGVLSGTCTTGGSYDFTVRATDGASRNATKPLTQLVAGALLSSFGVNGSFESGLTNWTQLGSGSGVTYAIVSDATHGTSAVRVTNRTQLTHAPGQAVFSTTLVDALGTPMTSRFSIKLDAPGMARCNLRLTSSVSGQPTTTNIFLAEAVVLTAGTWVEITGTAILWWPGTLTGAVLEFSAGQPVEGVVPDFTLDDIRVQRDGDADGICDVDETAATLDDPDRDHDGLPDGWETLHLSPGLLDPDVADATGDADADGFTNHEEYWAATDPLDAGSKPGVPCVSGATAAVQSILLGMALLPSRPANRVLAGQHITGATSLGGVPGEFASNVTALFNQTGKWPALLSMQYEGADTSIGPLQIDAVNAMAKSWQGDGGLVLIKYQPFDPWTLAQSGVAGQPQVDLVGLLDPAAGDPAKLVANTAANLNWMNWLDQIATGLDELQQAGIVVLWRPNSEMNNGSHWHSRQPREPWIAVWRHMHEYLSTTRGLKNLIWVYEGDAVAHAVVPADYYYPGDDVVDFMGHNFYDDDWVLPYNVELVFRRYPKVYGFPQAGSASIRDGTWDNRLMIEGIRRSMPRASLFCTWNDFYTGGNVFTARSMVGQSFAAELLADPWVVTRAELGW